ncbi:MAG TPA: hypothetical protein VGV61_05000, partial [Thermoanaerobaculia bacterium]|nr:hypothetical protein [Thermoanaerobaculia bacterium]
MSFRGSGATLPADLVEAAGAQDLGPELVHMAWELARLAMPAPADASAPEERALLLVALALLAAQRDGSTRVPLAAAGGSAPLERLLVDLGATPSDRTAVDGLLARAAAGDARLRPLFGGAGDYRPLLRVGDHLYAQRLWELERRVAARLRELLPAPATNAPAAVSAALADVRERPARDAAGRPV